MKNELKFIDLFAGLGGFHLALNELGHKCVFASELNDDLRELYKNNFDDIESENIKGNIHDVNVEDIPAHDILCAGFPCQPFSQAGKRKGLKDPVNGNHFNKILEILEYHKPEYLILENVQNLHKHDEGRTWETIKSKLEAKHLGYKIKEKIFSPHEFGIPQHRKRIYIVGKKINLNGFEFPIPSYKGDVSFKTIQDKEPNPDHYVVLKDKTKHQLEIWQEFLDNITDVSKVPRFPVWAGEFGATYPYLEKATTAHSIKELNNTLGEFGIPIKARSTDDLSKFLPKYALSNQVKFPDWKIKYISSNREFFLQNKEWLIPWRDKILNFEHSHQKFEWNCGFVPLKIKENIIQFRPSGIRIKKPNFSPALVLSSTQIPIIFDKKLNDYRYMTKDEAAALQSMQNLKEYPLNNIAAFKAFGNAVNVRVVREIVKKLLKNE